ncbi:guanylate kinase [Sulfurihydrogenibium azorense Az-Fu1]|uniref:Guanylate kinase n=1 Tax=Sulfurihydrogenibium azorense (strain DSM 15241 / OCM 825 / Az-Fu1) TaxID=204536 RepID=C1DT35_SULAA|nr:guanylate kinase [Sulfurihydrogenibium azorense]ACN99378.1 guanylate kinase [Sulfurihydrogenibium azorense Az-Fu1]
MKGRLYIVSSPAGGGKTTIINLLLEELPFLRRVITYTTRHKRKNEIDGVDYVFIKKEEFERLIQENAFLEYALVHGNYYGTPKKDVFQLLEEGYDVVLVIDVQGMKQVKQIYPDVITIFILPPSLEELVNRMKLRGDSEQEIEKRLNTARKEIPFWKEYDYIVVNDNLFQAKDQIKCIITAEKCKVSRFDLDNIKDESLKSLMI